MSDDSKGPCKDYCAVVDECQARGVEIVKLRTDLAVMQDALAHANQMQRDTESARVGETNALRFELAAARALLREALAHLKTGQWDVPTDITLMARIDAALKVDGE